MEIQKRLDHIAQINKRSTAKKKRDVSACHHWLSGILICSSCGKTLAYCGSSNQKSFQCWAYSKGMCRESHSILVPKAEEAVIDGLTQLLSSDNLQYTVVHQAYPSDKKQELQRILSRLDERERRAKDAYLNGIDSLTEYKDMKMQIQGERNRILAELDSLSTEVSGTRANDNLLMIQNVQSALTVLTDPDADYTKKGLAVRGIVDKIVYDRKNTSFDFYLKLVK